MALNRKQVYLPVRLFYDGDCPICMREVDWLSRHNDKRQLILINIRDNSFAQDYPQLKLEQLELRIHALLDDGRIVTGVDATLAAWEAVGKGWILTPLNWPGVRCLAEASYDLFARNRYDIARHLGPLLGKNTCSADGCSGSSSTRKS